MGLDYYYMPLSGPCRSVLLLAKALNIPLNKKMIDLFKCDQMKPEFIALNPQHTVPTLVDDGFSLWESRAILTYLATKYGNDSLYSKDPKERANIDRLLYFDIGTLYQRFADYVYPVMFYGAKSPVPENKVKLEEALAYLDKFLTGHKFAVGNRLTVADYAFVATISSIDEVGICLKKYSNITTWLNRCKTEMIGYNTENQPGATEFGEAAKSKGKF